MSETDLDREPIELVEIVLPKCVNTYGVAPCTASAGAGAECYNCRATCQSVANYRDTPDRHLTPDQLYADKETFDATDFTRAQDFFGAVDLRFGSDPEGVIFNVGNTVPVYIGVTSGLLEFVIDSTTTGTVSVDVSPYTGKSVTLYFDIDFTASGTSTIRLWLFDKIDLSLTLLGTDTLTTGTVWTDNSPGAIGEVNGTTVAGKSVVDWNGGINEMRAFNSQTAPSLMPATFAAPLWLGRGELGEPTDQKYILPCLDDLGTIGTRINVGASDDDYQPLGRRATLDFTATDFTHSDITQDPYFATRLTNPEDSATFWRKWMRRQKYGKTGALVRVYDGYAGQRLTDYKVRAYVLDKAEYTEDGIAFHCRDVLSRTEFRKTQVPAPSNGLLNADIDNAVTTFDITGDVTEEYPAAGTVRINDELITYTGRTFGTKVTTFTGITRGTDGSTADDHEIDDLVQLCRRYTNASISDVLEELLLDDAGIEGQLVNLAEIEDETAAYLDAYNMTTLITEPTGVDVLIGQMSAECSFYIWWDERVQQVRMLAIRAVALDDITSTWTYEDNIVGGTFKLQEKPKQRLNIVTFYYNPIDFAGDLDKPANFANGLKVINGLTSLPEQYGNVVQTREIFSRWLTTEAEANQTSSRLTLRYADVPEFAEFLVDAKDRDRWVGDVVEISHPMVVNADGSREIRRWLIMEAEEIDPGHLVRYICADITLDGKIYFITENSVVSYTRAEFEAGLGFITDNFGLNPDGTSGATIS